MRLPNIRSCRRIILKQHDEFHETLPEFYQHELFVIAIMQVEGEFLQS